MIFFLFGSFDQKTMNEKGNEPDKIHKVHKVKQVGSGPQN